MKKQLLFFILLCYGVFCVAQEHCYLGIGGKDNETIINYFELSPDQQQKLKNWSAELAFRNEPFLVRLDKLLKKHKESSVEELMQMSYTYKAYLDSLDANMMRVDQKLLGTFTNEQYNRYVSLCNYAQRLPIYARRPLNE